MKRILLFIIAAFHSLFPNEGIFFRNYSINDGLTQSTVISIIQDNRGFIWFGTQFGLNRFDGYQFYNYYSEGSNTESLCGNTINSMLIDNMGELWIATDNGLNRYNSQKDSFIRYYLSNDSMNVNPNNIRTIFNRSDSELLIGTSDGLYVFNKMKGTSYKVKTDNIHIADKFKVNSILIFGQQFWIGTDKGLLKLSYDLSRSKLIKIYNKQNVDLEISSLVPNKENIIIGCFPGIFEFNLKTEQIKDLKSYLPYEQELHVRQLYKNNSGDIWVATWSGLFLIKDDYRLVQNYFTDEREGSLSDNAINKIFIDRAGILWIGTSFGGVNYSYPRNKKFEILRTDLSEIKSPNKNIISGIAVKDGIVYYGTVGEGLVIYDRVSGKYKNLREENGLLSNLIRSTYLDSNKLWVGYWINGLSCIDLKSLSVDNYIPPNSSTNQNESSVVSMIKINNRMLLGTSNSGLLIFDSEVNSFEKKGTITSIINCFDKAGDNIFIGTGSGIYRFRTNNITIEKLHDDINNSVIQSLNVLSLKCKGLDTIIIGSNGSGVFFINVKNGITKQINKDTGLSDNVVYCMVMRNGNIWLSTNRGISKISLKTLAIDNYYPNDGLSSNEFNKGSVAESPEGEIFFGSISGITYFKPENIGYNKYLPPLYLSEIKLFNDIVSLKNKDIISGDFYNISEIRIPYSRNMIALRFSALNFIYSDKNEYSYIIEGEFSEWINIGTQRTISFANLEPGTYMLKVRCKNNDGIRSDKILSVNLVVVPPYYLTIWFKIIIILMIVIGIYVIYKVRINYLVGLEKIRVKIASDLHDDIGSSLTKITLNAGLGLYEDSIEKIKNRLEKIENMSREIVSNMSDIIWSIDARKDHIGDLLNKMQDYAFSISELSGIKISIFENGLEAEKKINAEIRQNIYLIFKEAVNNAVKYSGTDRIEIRLISGRKSFIMIIKDFGKGFSKESRLSGNGLKNMKERAEFLKGEIVYTNSDGLEVKLLIPSI